ncbi:hypothetical protein D9599_01540 [Roseomonas sp. KE2513]|uniref:cell division protein FtsL n=1 Tax=Roseomonas sp. KE2513 TaxID=2479202 RepID=UPI0018DFE22C|nr:hypothetical protein [Roseomonas sp. KE2513]MBI0534256.1 hypothetical protein [Roseomonas sp. KE2513]
MIRPLTFLSLMAAAGAGLHLYGVKHEVSQLERTLRETVKQTELARERTAVLRAEWALLNEPERLRAAAVRNLPLGVMETAQFVRPADLERRLPPAIAFAGAPSLFANGPAVARADETPEAASAVASAPAAVNVAPVAAALAAAANAAARVAQAAVTPAAQAAPVGSRSVQVATARAAQERSPERTATVERAAIAVVRPAPSPERGTAVERVGLPAPLPPRQPSVAAPRLPEPVRAPDLRASEPRAPEARPAEAKAPRALATPARQPDIRLTEREVDRGMNLSAPPQPAALLRTALHMRPPGQAGSDSARSPEAASALGAAYGAARLSPPVPVASASAATLDRRR